MRLLLAVLILGACSSARTMEVIKVPKAEWPLADAKVRLIGLLLRSLHNQRDGIVDVKLERQIQTLEKQIRDGAFEADKTGAWGTGFQR
jgi:hypothetical protein